MKRLVWRYLLLRAWGRAILTWWGDGYDEHDCRGDHRLLQKGTHVLDCPYCGNVLSYTREYYRHGSSLTITP